MEGRRKVAREKSNDGYALDRKLKQSYISNSWVSLSQWQRSLPSSADLIPVTVW